MKVVGGGSAETIERTAKRLLVFSASRRH